MLCGARTRSGGRCRRRSLAGKRRCRLHGGRSTGPRDWRANVNSMWWGRKRSIEQRRAPGLKAPGGRPSGRWWKRAVDERERILRSMADLIEKLPTPPTKSIEEWSLPELLNDTARVGLMRLHSIISQPLKLKQSPDDRLDREELKLQRLVGELGLGADKLLARVGEAELHQQERADALELLAKKMAEAEKKLPPEKDPSNG